ncbi:MAG: MFS transporter [Candidatus Glassbacteria bacterium]|nr:MFS transporter [Candidatus Glassbacteria bacterium]
MQLDNRKAVFGWTMYDWANSAFATSIMAGLFPFFFREYWRAGLDESNTQILLALANSVGSIVVALSAPLLGAIADRGTAKKKFLMFFAFLGVVMTSSLYLVSKGEWPLAVMLYVLSCIGFCGGNIFYDSLITGVASEKKMDFVSALGYALGYLGGGILFSLNAWMVLRPETFWFAGRDEAVRFAFLSVGIWWAAFSVPIFLFVKEPEASQPVSGLQMVRAGLNQLRGTFHEIRHLKTVFLFLLAYWLYIDGVDTIIRMAINHAQNLGFREDVLIPALLIPQFVGFPCAIGFGYLGGRLGTKRALLIAVASYLFISLWGAFIQSKADVYVLAVLIGLVQGGIQALSRSFYTRIIPVNKSAEYFGFYNMLGKFAAVIGPLLLAGVVWLLKSMGYSPDISSRIGIGSISLMFIAGGILLYFVDEKKGRQEARYLSE